jgi:hypothetical protein
MQEREMRIAVAVIALFVFAALLVMDTGAILGLAYGRLAVLRIVGSCSVH